MLNDTFSYNSKNSTNLQDIILSRKIQKTGKTVCRVIRCQQSRVRLQAFCSTQGEIMHVILIPDRK